MLGATLAYLTYNILLIRQDMKAKGLPVERNSLFKIMSGVTE